MVEPNETVKASEKSPELSATYKSMVLSDTNQNVSTFILQKHPHENQNDRSTILSDDDTVDHENLKFHTSIRMIMVLKLPSKKDDCSDDDAPKITIKK